MVTHGGGSGGRKMQEVHLHDVMVAKKMRTYFEMGTDGHRFLCFQFGIS